MRDGTKGEDRRGRRYAPGAGVYLIYEMGEMGLTAILKIACWLFMCFSSREPGVPDSA